MRLEVADGLEAVLSFMDPSIEVDYNMVYIVVIVKERGCMPVIYTPMVSLLLSSVSVNHPGCFDTRRGRPERAFMPVLRSILPPFVQWVVVRPGTLLEGDVSEYTLHEGLVSSLFPRSIRSS